MENISQSIYHINRTIFQTMLFEVLNRILIGARILKVSSERIIDTLLKMNDLICSMYLKIKRFPLRIKISLRLDIRRSF